jgi:hypothetical protein
LSVQKTPAHVKAHATGRWAETTFRALSSRVAYRWKFISFRGANKSEWRGVVDLIATRYDGMSEIPIPRCLQRLSDLYLETEPRLGIEISFGHAKNVRLHH